MQRTSRCVLAALFVVAGIAHLLWPKPFIQIVPPSMPFPGFLVAISGLAEIVGGLGLLPGPARPYARWWLVALLAAVFPANVYMAQAHVNPDGMHLPEAALWARLPMQPLLIWWVVAATKKTVLHKKRPV